MEIDGKTLKQARELCDYTQTELADKLNVSLRTIVNWEAGGVPRKSIVKVVHILGSAISAVQASTEWDQFLDGPEGSTYLAESVRRHDSRESTPLSAIALGRPIERLRRTQIITENLDDLDLMYELIRRSSNLGVLGDGVQREDVDPGYREKSD